MSRSASIGIDVGGTKTRVALFDKNFDLVEDFKFKTPKTRRVFTMALTKSVRKLLKKASGEQLEVSAIGLGLAGSVDSRKGILKSAPNIPCLKGFSFKKTLGHLCHCDIVLLNDVQAALYGELKLGKAVGYNDVLAIFIGTGISGAVAIGGNLHFGASLQAGNIGHYLVHAIGPLAGSERHGILDDFASRTAIAGAAATFAAKHWAPYLLKTVGTDVRQIKSSTLANAIRAGDKSIEELVRSRIRIVGIVLSNMVDFLNPEMIVLGGGLTDSMARIVRHEVIAGIHNHSVPTARRVLKVVTTKHKGNAVTIGAARFAVDSLKASAATVDKAVRQLIHQSAA